MRRLATAVTFIALLTTCTLAGVTGASANNDPYRFPFGSVPTLLNNNCAFPVLLTPVLNNTYASATTLPDGSTVYKFSGGATVAATNENTGKTRVYNTSGPGTNTVSADGLTIGVNTDGVGVGTAINATDFGFPSNLIQIAGPVNATGTIDPNTGDVTITSWPLPHPTVLHDICADLSGS